MYIRKCFAKLGRPGHVASSIEIIEEVGFDLLKPVFYCRFPSPKKRRLPLRRSSRPASIPDNPLSCRLLHRRDPFQLAG